MAKFLRRFVVGGCVGLLILMRFNRQYPLDWKHEGINNRRIQYCFLGYPLIVDKPGIPTQNSFPVVFIAVRPAIHLEPPI